MVTITLVLGAVILRLAWEVSTTSVASSLAILILVIMATAGIYALVLYLLITPSLKKLRSLPVGIWVTGIFTAGLIGAIIHFIRFVPSPSAASPLSIIIAVLLLMAAITGYALSLRVIWSFWKSRIT